MSLAADANLAEGLCYNNNNNNNNNKKKKKKKKDNFTLSLPHRKQYASTTKLSSLKLFKDVPILKTI
jgi:hypothetical protein